jgi:hypothetical protein
MPHHSAPRLGSVCLNEGIAPWAAAKGHPWPSAANPASMPGCPLHNASVQPAWLTGRRDQRPPRGGLVADLVLLVVHPSDMFELGLWEQSLLAIAVSQSMKMLDEPTPSRASSLPLGGSGCTQILCLLKIRCGSELARDSGVPVNEDVGCADPFASKLAPTGFRRRGRAKGPLMQMIEAFGCVYECFSITHGIMHAVMNSK